MQIQVHCNEWWGAPPMLFQENDFHKLHFALFLKFVALNKGVHGSMHS